MKRIFLGNEKVNGNSVVLEKGDNCLLASFCIREKHEIRYEFKVKLHSLSVENLKLFLKGFHSDFYEQKVLITKCKKDFLHISLIKDNDVKKFLKLEAFDVLNLAEFLNVEYQTK